MKPKENKTKRWVKKNPAGSYALKLSALLLLFFFINNMAVAQNTSAQTTLQPTLHYLLAALGIIILIFFYVLQKAIKILRENGRDVVFTYPLFRTLANNSKAVSVLVLLAVLAGIFWAIQFKP